MKGKQSLLADTGTVQRPNKNYMVPEALILIVVSFFSVNAAGQRGGSGFCRIRRSPGSGQIICPDPSGNMLKKSLFLQKIRLKRSSFTVVRFCRIFLCLNLLPVEFCPDLKVFCSRQEFFPLRRSTWPGRTRTRTCLSSPSSEA